MCILRWISRNDRRTLQYKMSLLICSLEEKISSSHVTSVLVLTDSSVKVKMSCTTTSDTVCEPLEGFYCVDFTDGGCATAQKHTSCQPGQYVSDRGGISRTHLKAPFVIYLLLSCMFWIGIWHVPYWPSHLWPGTARLIHNLKLTTSLVPLRRHLISGSSARLGQTHAIG